MTQIAECVRCRRRLVIRAKGLCHSCDSTRFKRPVAHVTPSLQRLRSVTPIRVESQ